MKCFYLWPLLFFRVTDQRGWKWREILKQQHHLNVSGEHSTFDFLPNSFLVSIHFSFVFSSPLPICNEAT